ncbi:receptor-like protein kinase [Dorcoceras hygrometricum]|uniref:Receptor-like protein kinase n=1 Tax=Dorcoceras hygrometricum TaxID=472368 RepID=A0A2Z7AUY2_9LAMI|nr:receptor-like protein kinase [Dorcoceras hygrometricum]
MHRDLTQSRHLMTLTSRVARYFIAMHTSWRSNSDIAVVVLLIRSTTGITTPSSFCIRKRDKFITDGISSSRWSEQVQPRRQRTAAGGGARWAAAVRENGVRGAANALGF